MERFNYPNLAAVYDEDASIIRLLELEAYGDKGDQLEEMEEIKARTREGGY